MWVPLRQHGTLVFNVKIDERGGTMNRLIFVAVAAIWIFAPHKPAFALGDHGWHDAYDLDGDGQRDRIQYEFSGGAHCCYQVGVTLSSNGKTVMVPFRFDGGYVGGLDLSQPNRFTVRTTDHGLPELIMEIET